MKEEIRFKTQMVEHLKTTLAQKRSEVKRIQDQAGKCTGLDDVDEWHRLKSTERNLLTDISLIKYKINNLEHGRPAHGYADGMATGSINVKGTYE